MPSSTNALADKTLMPVTPTTAKGETALLPVTPTTLKPEIENLYKGWVLTHNIPESNDYDMRGYFLDLLLGNKDAKAGINPADMQMHFTDKWKLPNHPKFSNESVYSRSNQDPRWIENPAPYKEGTWARRDKYNNNLDIEIPQ